MLNYGPTNRLEVFFDAVLAFLPVFSKFKIINDLANNSVLFQESDTITVTTGSFGTDASFKGTIGSLSLGCATQPMNYQRSIFQGSIGVSETKLKGLWYFDENSLPRPNLANPYNLEPKFHGHLVDTPLWDTTLNRWTVFDGKKLFVEFGNFLDYRPEEIVRTMSIVLDLRLMTPLSGTIPNSLNQQIATLISDIEIALVMQVSFGTYSLNVMIRGVDD